MEKQIEFILNDEEISLKVNPALPLLDFIRNEARLSGTKEVCREGDCGACTVIVGEMKNNILKYKSVTSCIYPVGNIDGCHVVTIEGLNNGGLTPQQKSFYDEGASQCGFCTPGFLMSLTGYLLNNGKYTYDDAINAVSGNICRCTGYESIKRAVGNLTDEIKIGQSSGLEFLIEKGAVPEYFRDIEIRIAGLKNRKNYPSDSELTVGGGTDLFVQNPESMLEKSISFIKNKDLDFIDEDESRVILGAGLSFEEFKSSKIIKKLFPRLPEQLNLIASQPIRNMATIAGNIINASPIADLVIILLALDATVVLKSETERIVKLSDLYLDYKKLAVHSGEIIEAVFFSKPRFNSKFNFEKVSKRTHLDIASVNTAFYIETENNRIKKCRISAGGAAPIPKLLSRASRFLEGGEITESNILAAAELSAEDVSPISDIRGSAEYKRILLAQLIKAHFIELFPERLNGGELL